MSSVWADLKTHAVKLRRTGCSFGTKVREMASESQNSFHVFLKKLLIITTRLLSLPQSHASGCGLKAKSACRLRSAKTHGKWSPFTSVRDGSAVPCPHGRALVADNSIRFR